MKRSRLIGIATTGLAALAAWAPALGQIAQESKLPPTPSGTGNPPLLLYYGVLFLLALGTIGLGILKSKRNVQT